MTRSLALTGLLAVLLTLASATAIAAPHFRLVDLGLVPGGTSAGPNHFGPGGSVLGWTAFPGVLSSHATRWNVSPEGAVLGVTDLQGLAGFNWSAASAMNAGGWIVGHSNTADPQPRAVLWRDGAVIDIERTADGNANIYALGVNDAGVICGFLTKSGGGGNWDAAIWIERAGQPGRFDRTLLPLHPSGDPVTGWTESQSILASGQVFGRTNLGAGDRATIWEADATHTPVLLEPLAGSNQSMPGDVNELGDAVGITMYPFGLDVPTRWSRDAAHVPSALPQWPGHNAAQARVVNATGTVVLGQSELIDTSVFPWPALETRQVLWTANGIWDLDAALDASGAGWTITGTSDLNANDWIAATATFAGVSHAVLLIPTGSVTAVAADPRPRLELANPAPNPSRGAVTLAFTLERETSARLELVDAQGRRVATLASGPLPPGRHAFAWDGHDARGARVGAGVYFAVLDTGDARTTRRLVRVR